MTIGAAGLGHLVLVHFERLRSPFGAALLGAAAFLIVALWVARRRRLHNLTATRERASELAHSSSTKRLLLREGLASARERGPDLARTAVGRLRRRRQPDLASILAPYRLAPLPPRSSPGEDAWALLTLPWLKKLSLWLENLAGRAGVAQPLTTLLERAGIRVRVGELLSIWLLGGAVLVMLGWALADGIGSLLVLVLVVVAPLAGLQGAADHRARLFASQLPDVLKLTASSLRAGFSLLQGLDAVTRQLREPSAGELQRVLTEARLGRPVEDALESAAARIRNRDFSESVAAVRIQQEAGGNLASLFDTLAETMVQRLRLRREVRTLTAEGRLSAYILGAMPLLLGVFIFAVNRSYMLELFHSFPGKVMLVGGLVLQVIGFYWMYRIVKIET
jgi:Flp pilus assembly protein TadB